jgi:hypothetical protein
MTPSTNNVSLLFVTRRPAWEEGVSLRMNMDTSEFTARSGSTQRQGRRTGSMLEIQYTAVLDRDAALARQQRALSEVRAPLIVPFWCERAATTTAIVANQVTVDRTPDEDFFRAGDYVLFSSNLGDQFRQIASVSGSTLTLEPDGEALAYLTGATVWPCRACVRDAAGASFEVASEDSQVEPLKYTSL